MMAWPRCGPCRGHHCLHPGLEPIAGSPSAARSGPSVQRPLGMRAGKRDVIARRSPCSWNSGGGTLHRWVDDWLDRLRAGLDYAFGAGRGPLRAVDPAGKAQRLGTPPSDLGPQGLRTPKYAVTEHPPNPRIVPEEGPKGKAKASQQVSAAPRGVSGRRRHFCLGVARI